MAKERISLTLDEGVVDRVDAVLAQKGISNRSRGIEQLLREYLKQESLQDAVVLAGGTDPNCLIPVNGRPVIEHILDHLERSGVKRVFITTADDTLADKVDADREIAVEFVLEDEPRGTAGALAPLSERLTDAFLVMNGDVLCNVDLEDMKSAHEDSGGLATIALTTVGDSSNYGVIRMKGSQIVGFTEKPDESFSKLINAGMYILEPELLTHIADDGTGSLEDLFEELADDGRLHGYVYDGEWHEVGE